MEKVKKKKTGLIGGVHVSQAKPVQQIIPTNFEALNANLATLNVARFFYTDLTKRYTNRFQQMKTQLLSNLGYISKATVDISLGIEAKSITGAYPSCDITIAVAF